MKEYEVPEFEVIEIADVVSNGDENTFGSIDWN